MAAKALATAVLLVAGVACFSAARAQDAFAATVPLLSCSGLPCVDGVVGGGQRVRWLIDTGDVEAIVKDSTATALGLERLPLHSQDGKEVPGYQSAVVHGLSIGGTPLGDVKVIAADLKALTNNHPPEADGFLTYPAFKNRLLRLDFVHHTVSVSAPLEAAMACTGTCASLQYPTFGTRGPPIVLSAGFSVNGQPVSAQIDTLFTGAILIYPHALRKLGFEKDSRTTDKVFFPYTDGGVDMLRAAARDVSFGGVILAKRPSVYFATPAVHAPDGLFDATVGIALLAHAVVTFNFHDDWIAISN